MMKKKISNKLKCSKGQTNVVQFVLFFLVGLSIFTAIGNFFRVQSEILRDDLSEYSVEMINGYMSSIIISSVDGCKGCDTVENTVELSDTVFGYFLEIDMIDINDDENEMLTVYTVPDSALYSSNIHNLKESISILVPLGAVSTIQPINLTYDRTQNKLEIK